MIDRNIVKVIIEEKDSYPVLVITGPRQSGKTTLCRNLFNEYEYILLEDLEIQRLAKVDPKGFFSRFKGSLILDEVQKAPELLSYIQGIVDQPGNTRQFVLSGSENLLLSNQVSQSLAGRARIYSLLPFSSKELKNKKLNDYLLHGGYPRIYDKNLNSYTWLSQYYSTYVEKDIRNVLNIKDLDSFDKFVRICASRVGQILDYSNISNSIAVSSSTVKSWMSSLKSTYICFTLEPHYKNFGKRLIKSPKIYFYDTGLLCYLLKIKNEEMLETHPQYGNIFENWVVSELFKRRLNLGQEPDYYFWRNQRGNEIDLITETQGKLDPIEIKSSKTFGESFLKNIKYLNKLQDYDKGTLIYSGDESYNFKTTKILSWKDI